MAFTELEARRNEAALRSFLDRCRPPAHIRSKLDIGYSVDGQVVEVFEIRPDWKDEKIIRNHAFARLRFFKSRGLWRLYWLRANLKWDIYEPHADHKHLERALAVIEADEYGCFFG